MGRVEEESQGDRESRRWGESGKRVKEMGESRARESRTWGKSEKSQGDGESKEMGPEPPPSVIKRPSSISPHTPHPTSLHNLGRPWKGGEGEEGRRRRGREKEERKGGGGEEGRRRRGREEEERKGRKGEEGKERRGREGKERKGRKGEEGRRRRGREEE
ncbi:hypothetical protein Pcinc_024747 [Petrolisthes cinctipes]|uniref:Uncharacterized protein n=1 Tax=Petrolisthes cinctipes TaxID=88211 RepID=A0AAE1F9B1_PETCI|nr:hypothetical protein Pcinc_024747 [Petrolisthes cinctipes]